MYAWPTRLTRGAAGALDRLRHRPARRGVVDHLRARLPREHRFGEQRGGEVAGDELAGVVDEEAAVGIAVEGDRCFFVDDSGEFVPGDFATALFAESVLAKEPGAKVIYDVRADWAVPETIERAGGTPLINRVGHAYIEHRMREEHAAFGGEVSGRCSSAASRRPRFGGRAVSADARAPLEARPEASGSCGPSASASSSPARELNAVEDVDAKLAELEEHFGPKGASAISMGSRSRPMPASERAASDAATTAAAEPRGARSRADGAQARRGAGRDPRRGLI